MRRQGSKSETEAPPPSFHDCHVHGMAWRRDRYLFCMDVQYILEWIEPEGGASAYSFLVSEARVTFRNVDELRVSMDWTGSALDAEIAEVRVTASRQTPAGKPQRRFEIEFANPNGVISFWSTGYELTLTGEPVVSPVPSISIHDEA